MISFHEGRPAVGFAFAAAFALGEAFLFVVAAFLEAPVLALLAAVWEGDIMAV